MKRDLHDSEIIRARIRGLQAIYQEAHNALTNWGKWSRDRYGIYPPGITAPGLWNEALPSKFGDFGDEQEADDGLEAKAEKAEREEYCEKSGANLDWRINSSPEFPLYLREVAKVAYVSREIPEDQFPRNAGCTEDAFCERLEGVLRFAARHV